MKILTTPNLYNQRKSVFQHAGQNKAQAANEPEVITPQILDKPADPQQDSNKDTAKAD